MRATVNVCAHLSVHRDVFVGMSIPVSTSTRVCLFVPTYLTTCMYVRVCWPAMATEECGWWEGHLGPWSPSICPPSSDGTVTPLSYQMAGLLPLLRDSFHRPFTMLWPTDSALQALPPDRQVWLYHKDHRDKLAAIVRGHVIDHVIKS